MLERKSRTALRAKAYKIRNFICKNFIAVIENPDDIMNIGTIIRNVNALGVHKAYVVTGRKFLPDTWQEMRVHKTLGKVSASAIKWTFVKVFEDTGSCMNHLQKKGFVSAVTSPHLKGYRNVLLHEHDYTQYKKLAVWFGNEGHGISELAVERSRFCINIPMYGIIESLNLGTSSGIILYEIARQRRAFHLAVEKTLQIEQKRLATGLEVLCPPTILRDLQERDDGGMTLQKNRESDTSGQVARGLSKNQEKKP